ncbi:calpain-11 isoform d [Limosa lapponica baueri]|uniref:Calpain-11 isoform d n=1 Tax=Limosa lapponica baueri TaxID=1758121 RepID=A0A2I0UM77_LIMLA|nr:calpain-11 isoform d [Limosa lapponica baueri]
MSGSTARKVQPFTISTKLSLPKCATDFPGDTCPGIALASALDNHRGLHRSLNERISLYLAQARASPTAPEGQPRSPSPGEDGGTDEERLNRNSLARSIKKITLSNWHGEAGKGDAGGPEDPARTGSERNHNNNNSRPGKAHFKVFLRKDVDVENEQQAARSPRASGFCSPVDRSSPFRAAEGWVRGKLRDMKDGCDLQDWEEVAQTLQRDMKDFENTLIKLNQMGEQLMWRASPSAEGVRRQLLALRDQWQLLKQTAASQSKALGGLRSLQDFNRKAERLEAWIRHKEEKLSLAALLQESPDKIQLTRRILDLKQEEQQFQSLHEELNSLAQKLEKQGKSESRSISARRKHLNKTWLRLQGTLKEHHEVLQLALEVAAFLQQADTLLGAIHAKQRSICGVGKPGEGEPCRDRDVRDIASQVMMLDVTVSQLLSLQPSLAAQVTPKHRDVKERWAQLQQALRRRREAEAERGTQQLEAQVQDTCQVVNVEEPVPGVHPGSPQVEAMLRELGELWEDLQRKHQENGAVLREIDKALRLVGELDRAERWLQSVAGSLSEPATMRSPAELRQDLEETGQLERQLLLCGLKLQALREEAASEPPNKHDGARKMQRKVEMVEEKLAGVQVALRRRAADLRDSLVLSEFLQDLQEEEARSRQGPAAPGSGRCGSQGSFPLLSGKAGQPPSSEDMSHTLGELQEAVEMLNDAAKERERVMEVAAEMENLERLVADVSPRLEALRCRAEALARDTAQAESGFTAVKSEKDLQGLQGLLSQQQEMEHAASETLQGQLEELERAAARLQELCPSRLCPVSQEVEGTLRAWAELQELLRENRAHVQQASRLRSFFKDYLAMISWTEDTRAQIFSESPSGHGLTEAPCEELERRIEGKLKEFEVLAAVGEQLVSEEHYLSAMIKERLEELQSMLGWVLVRWRAQRHQRDTGSKQEDRRDTESPSGTSPTGQEQCASCAQPRLESIHSPVEFMPCSLPKLLQESEPQVLLGMAISPPASPLSDAPMGVEQSWGEPSSSTPCGVEPPEEAVIWDPAETSTLLLPPRGPSGLGGTVNLIFSIGKKGEKKKVHPVASGEWPGEEALRTEQVEARKTSDMKQPPVAVRRPPASGIETPSASHTLPKTGAGSLFNSLQRRERARAEQARLLTLQGIMGASSLQPAPEEHHGPSNTWPQKCGRRKGGPGTATASAGPHLGELLLYVRNPLVRDIDAECGAATRDTRRPDPKTTCPHLSLGSEEVEGQEQRQGGRREEADVEELVSTAPLDSPGAWDRQRHGEEEREGGKVPPSKTEFQMMEGTLERKHVLQTGGRKASCRAWGLFHAVLMRQTLCFYQDRKDSLKSSVVALPLNLSGAVCTPDAEYTKKTNCFRLQLRDGSEYLLRAPSQPLMNEWVSKLQQNSGFPEVDYFQAATQHVEGTGGAGGFSKVPSPGSSHLQGHHQVMTAKSQEIMVLRRSNTRLQRPLGSQDGPDDGAVAAAEDIRGSGHREQQWSPRGSPGLWDNSCQEDDYGLVANKRRSYSFTSATYQKITPVAVPKEPVEAGSSYSVTLYIGEQAAAMPRARCHSFVARPGTPRDTLREKTPSPLRPKNKSVFKKFFGKKE